MNPTGAQYFPATLSPARATALSEIAEDLLERPGVRLHGKREVMEVARPGSILGQIAAELMGATANPVRAVLFDKSAANNWIVPWHQDRTIAVKQRKDVPGFGPWSRKAGIWHVEPPFEITARMVTLRAHLDDCDENNAPLLYVPGSHVAGKIPAQEVAAFARQKRHAMSLADGGDVWAYATSIVHGSEPAKKPGRRRVLQIDYSADDLPDGLEWMGI